jgi:hypothetical protein
MDFVSLNSDVFSLFTFHKCLINLEHRTFLSSAGAYSPAGNPGSLPGACRVCLGMPGEVSPGMRRVDSVTEVDFLLKA